MRIEQITFTRFIAAISIVIFHFGTDVFPFNNQLGSFFFKQGNLTVSYFFILSGFVMIIAYGNKLEINISEYIKSRFARIYPAYILAILIGFVFIITAHSALIDYSGIILNILAIQSWIPGKALSFNSAGWSLSVEIFFYSIFPFLLIMYKKINYSTLIIPILLFWIISQIVLHLFIYSHFYQGFPSKSHDFIFYFPIMHLNEFSIGNLAGLFFINKLTDKNRNYDLHILFIFLIFLFVLKFFPADVNFHNGILAVFFVPLMLLISLNTGKITSISNKKLMIYLGEISYGIYIFQFPIYCWTNQLLNYLQIDSSIIKFYVPLIVLIFVSGISYTFIEAPLRKRIKISA